MATINDIVDGALKRFRVLAGNETASSVDAADALTALNEMMFALKFEGADTQWDEAVLTTTFPLDDAHSQGVKAMLAVRLAEEYGKPVGAVLARDAANGLTGLRNDYGIIEDMQLDDALLNMPSQQRYYG